MPETVTNETMNADESEYRVIDLRRFIYRLWVRRYFIVWCAIGGMLVVYGLSWTIHPQYDATVRLMPPTPKQEGLSLLLPTKNPGDQYLGEISSRTVADDVIAHQHLAEYFHTTRPSELRRKLERDGEDQRRQRSVRNGESAGERTGDSAASG